ncbi:MAG: TPR repeat protein [Enterobacterales bacterium]|jgi:TPR repeat protein
MLREYIMEKIESILEIVASKGIPLKLIKSLLFTVSLLSLLFIPLAADARKSCFDLEGDRSKEALEKALELCSAQAIQGDADAQFLLGVLYAKLWGNFDKAVYWYSLAAKQGHDNAQYNLAQYYRIGTKIPKDYKKAINWYTKAAEQGHGEAQFNFAYMIYHGMGAPKDYKKAFYWMTKAAKNTSVTNVNATSNMNADAQLFLGLMYADGRGIIKDNIMGYAWLNVAAAQGNDQARKARDFVEKEMTSTQLEKAQVLSKLYFNKHVK